MRRLIAILLGLLPLVVVLAVPAEAWTISSPSVYSGYRWQHKTVCVEDRTPSNGLRDEVKNAVYDWNYNTHIVMWYKIGKGSCAGYNQQIHVSQGAYGKTGWSGRAYIAHSPGTTDKGTKTGIIVSPVTILINTSYSGGALVNGVWTNWDHVATHELGHSLGLGHVTASCDSVMSTRSGCSWRYQTSYYDRRAINQLYAV
jgi:Matrixin